MIEVTLDSGIVARAYPQQFMPSYWATPLHDEEHYVTISEYHHPSGVIYRDGDTWIVRASDGTHCGRHATAEDAIRALFPQDATGKEQIMQDAATRARLKFELAEVKDAIRESRRAGEPFEFMQKLYRERERISNALAFGY